jgi:hypothetical protein
LFDSITDDELVDTTGVIVLSTAVVLVVKSVDFVAEGLVIVVITFVVVDVEEVVNNVVIVVVVSTLPPPPQYHQSRRYSS